MNGKVTNLDPQVAITFLMDGFVPRAKHWPRLCQGMILLSPLAFVRDVNVQLNVRFTIAFENQSLKR